jgi:hypothetical protein
MDTNSTIMDRDPTKYQADILKRISELSGMHVGTSGLGKTKQVRSSLWRKRGKSTMSVLWDEKDRFVVTGPFDLEMPDYYILIRDYRWWSQNEKEIYQWMKECSPRGIEHHQGMVLTFEREADASNFLLRWR